MTKAQLRERDEAREELRKLLQPGDTVYTRLIHRSRSGMYRTIDLYVFRPSESDPRQAEPLRLTWHACKATGQRYDRRHEGMGMGGCGMDMGFAAVYELSHALFGNGFMCTGERCPSNDHSNGDRDYTPHEHKSGGYALRHRWIG